MKKNEYILGIGCSFTWGESLYFYSNLPDLPFSEMHNYDASLVTDEMIEFKNNNRYLKLLSDELKIPYVYPFDTNGGSIIGSNTHFLFEARDKYKDAKYVIWQITDWTRDLHSTKIELNNFEPKSAFRLIDGNIQKSIYFIKRVVDEFEKNNTKVILFTWQSDLVNHYLYRKFFIKTGKHMNIECEGEEFESFNEIVDSPLDKFKKYTVAYDFSPKGYLKNDTHFNIKGHQMIKDNLVKKIKEIQKSTLI